jgi:hypothetical protein
MRPRSVELEYVSPWVNRMGGSRVVGRGILTAETLETPQDRANKYMYLHIAKGERSANKFR